MIPVILRPVDWQGSAFAHLKSLPKDGKPVHKWRNAHEAFEDVTRGVRDAIGALRRPVATLPSDSARSNLALSQIIFNQSFGQDQWIGWPRADIGYTAVLQGRPVLVDSHDITLPQKKGVVMIIPTPRSAVDDIIYRRLNDWVKRGDSLRLFGFYLLEDHHRFNINKLALSFNITFGHDLIADPSATDYHTCLHQSFDYENPRYWVQGEAIAEPNQHRVGEGIRYVQFASSCTVDYAGKPDFLFGTRDLCCIMTAKGYRDEGGRRATLKGY